MIVMEMKLSLKKGKEKEFKQTARGLLKSIRKEQGCLTINLVKDLEENDQFYIASKWSSWEDLKNHFSSASFNVLLGARRTLGQEGLIQIMNAGNTLVLGLSEEAPFEKNLRSEHLSGSVQVEAS